MLTNIISERLGSRWHRFVVEEPKSSSILRQFLLSCQPAGIPICQKTLVANMVAVVEIIVVESVANNMLMLLTHTTFHLDSISFCNSPSLGPYQRSKTTFTITLAINLSLIGFESNSKKAALFMILSSAFLHVSSLQPHVMLMTRKKDHSSWGRRCHCAWRHDLSACKRALKAGIL